jgi:hypothetical protein
MGLWLKLSADHGAESNRSKHRNKVVVECWMTSRPGIPSILAKPQTNLSNWQERYRVTQIGLCNFT